MSRPPDFIIIGAMRAGTTALAAALGEHPDVLVSTPKEPNYFATLHGALDYCGPGDAWFASQNVSSWEDYTRLFDAGGSAVAGEASAMYLALPEAAASIASRVPSAKIIAVLREPLARARSAHGYLRARGRDPEQDFARSLELENRRRADGYGPMWWLRSASDYSPGLRAFASAFPESQMKIITTEVLEVSPEDVMDEVLDFLGVAPHAAPAGLLRRERLNASGEPRSELMTRALYPPDRMRRTLRRVAPQAVIRGVRALRHRSTALAEPMSTSVEVVEDFRELGANAERTLKLSPGALWPMRGTP